MKEPKIQLIVCPHLVDDKLKLKNMLKRYAEK